MSQRAERRQIRYASGNPRDARVASEQWQPFTYDDLVAREKVNVDITWLRDDSLEDLDNLPAPEVIRARGPRSGEEDARACSIRRKMIFVQPAFESTKRS